MSCPQAAKKSYCGANSNSHFITEPLILSLSIYIKFISYEYYEIFFLQYAYRFDVYKTIALMYLLRILRCIQYVYKYVWISLYAFKVKHTNIPLNHHPNVLSVYMLLHSWTDVNTHTHLQVCNAHIWTVQCKRFIHPHARYHVASCSHKVDALDFGCGGYQSFDADIGRPRRIKRPPQSRTGHCLNMRARSLLPLYDTNCTVHGEKIWKKKTE